MGVVEVGEEEASKCGAGTGYMTYRSYCLGCLRIERVQSVASWIFTVWEAFR